MKLDRNKLGNEGRGKYALLKLRELAEHESADTFGGLPPELSMALETLEKAGVLDWGEAGTESEFFVIRLKDKYAQDALIAYSDAAEIDDREYAKEITELAGRAGPSSPFCKTPD